MPAPCTDADVRRALSTVAVKCSDAALLTRLAQAAGQLGLTAKAIATRYSAFTINSDDESKVNKATPALVESFISQLLRDTSNTARATPGRLAGSGGSTAWGARSWEEVGDTLLPGIKADQKQPPSTPLPPRGSGADGGSPLTPGSAPRSAFKERANSGQVVCVLNDHVPAATAPPDAPLRPELLGRQLPPRHCFMMERPEDKAAAIDARICEGRRRLGEALGAAFGSVAPVGEPVHEDAWFVGRVVSDAEGGAPTAASLGLEGDVATSAGARAALDLSLLPAVRLFPGQVVGVRGFNPTGARIVARQVVTHCQPPAAAAARAGATPSGMDVDSSAPGTVAAVAAGPFATADDPTCFEPLEALLAALAARPAPPALLVLAGPFVDVENPAVATGALDVTFQSLFAHQVVARVSAWQERLPSPCQVVLVPSVRDAHAMPVFPQPPLDVPGAAEGVVCLQNPSCFDAGGAMVVGCTSADVLRALAGTELQQGPRTDRIAALASHLLGQRSFYPLYPPVPGTCLDTTSDGALAMDVLPDLVLLPSDLAPFAKVVPAAGPYPECSAAGGEASSGGAAAGGSVLAVNPGRLVKGSGGGTYAVLTLAPGAAGAPGGLAANCRAEIVRV